MKAARCLFRLVLVFSILLFALAHTLPVEAQRTAPDTAHFLNQFSFGPTSILIAYAQQVGFGAFPNEQASAGVQLLC